MKKRLNLDDQFNIAKTYVFDVYDNVKELAFDKCKLEAYEIFLEELPNGNSLMTGSINYLYQGELKNNDDDRLVIKRLNCKIHKGCIVNPFQLHC